MDLTAARTYWLRMGISAKQAWEMRSEMKRRRLLEGLIIVLSSLWMNDGMLVVADTFRVVGADKEA